MTNGADVFPYDVRRPWESFMEQQESEALAQTQMPEDEVRAIRPPLPWIMAFPDRFGYPAVQDRAATIGAVLDANGLYPDKRNERSGESGDEAGYNGSSRNAMSQEPLG